MLAWLKKKDEDEQFGPFSNLPMWDIAMLSSNANSPVTDENTRE